MRPWRSARTPTSPPAPCTSCCGTPAPFVPAVTELTFVQALAGLRPGSPDNGPLLGPTALPGLHLATGHHRNGVLLTPVTADALAAALVGEPLPPEVQPFGPSRFAAPAAVAA